jgi:hypothetical protein
MNELIKTYGIDLFSICSLYMAIYLYGHGYPAISIVLLSVLIVLIILPAVFIIKYMIIKRDIFVFPILISSVKNRSSKLFFVFSNLIMYSIYFYLVYQFKSKIGEVGYNISFDTKMNWYLFAYFCSLNLMVIFDLIVFSGFFKSDYVDKKLAFHNEKSQ